MRPKLYTTAQAAKKIGISRQSLQTWIMKNEVAAPPMVGGNVRLWTEEDISKLQKVKARKAKPKKK
jgi:DNA-binding transcriptional MerR regulator